jgi:S-(hydroxymethyl)glutathione synthase
MKSVRNRIRAIGLEPYDCLSPTLMDVLATQAAKLAGVVARK